MDELKRAAGYRAADFVMPGMVVGLGSGTTARYATLRIGQRLREGTLHDIVGIPTSRETGRLAEREGIRLTTLEEESRIDVTIDGADEVDPHLDLIKGLGGFLLREKIVASVTEQEIIVVDDSKLVPVLGSRSPLPVEVLRFGWRCTEAALDRTGAETTLRLSDGHPYVTDEGNYIIDCRYDTITAPKELALALNGIPGVVENGLFLGLAHIVVVASHGGIDIRKR
ncbi:MAG: ribose-5-phosphate isomerase RpiA [Chloroflexota bacterium]|nr:ribose-5-phosphate isomerase RpiA [Chloroflexota bacterium]